MTNELIEVTVGRVRIKMPVIQDRQTTLRIVQAVNTRIEEIEARSHSIDSHAFALEAAISFAAQLDQAHKEAETERKETRHESDLDNKEMLLALTKINESLGSLLETIQDDQPDSPSPRMRGD